MNNVIFNPITTTIQKLLFAIQFTILT